MLGEEVYKYVMPCEVMAPVLSKDTGELLPKPFKFFFHANADLKKEEVERESSDKLLMALLQHAVDLANEVIEKEISKNFTGGLVQSVNMSHLRIFSVSKLN